MILRNYKLDANLKKIIINLNDNIFENTYMNKCTNNNDLKRISEWSNVQIKT